MGVRDREALRKADGHRMGARYRHRSDLHRAGATGDGAGVERSRLAHHLPAQGKRQASALRAGRRRSNRCRESLPHRKHAPTRQIQGRLHPCYGNDRSRLGSDLQKTKGIITNLGGRTCHAAIVSRELGIPAIVGTGEATKVLRDRQEVTLSCAEGDEGFVYNGLLDFAEEKVSLKKLPKTRTPIMLNIASPGGAFRWWKVPCDGIGLARIEFIIANRIQVHPMALAHFDELEDREARRRIEKLTHSYKDKRDYFIDKLAQGIAPIAASQHPRPVIMRLSDFKTNEYAALIGGEQFEQREQNPMLGLRGASRYYHEEFRDAFRLECEAIQRVRNQIGLKNVIVMVPFCRTLDEADKVLRELAENGLVRGPGGLEIYMMCEIPSNAVLAEKFGERFDGFSIGSNDLTQLVLGVDRDSAELAELFDERNEAVKNVVRQIIRAAHKADCKVGICGEAPSDYPEFAAFLVENGIDSISINPDRFIETKKIVAKAEGK